jgi:hypothetical protein
VTSFLVNASMLCHWLFVFGELYGKLYNNGLFYLVKRQNGFKTKTVKREQEIIEFKLKMPNLEFGLG